MQVPTGLTMQYAKINTNQVATLANTIILMSTDTSFFFFKAQKWD